MTYTEEEIQILYDSLNWDYYDDEKIRKVVIRAKGWTLFANNPKDLSKAVNNLDVGIPDPENRDHIRILSDCKEKLQLIFHNTPLEDVPLHINDSSVKSLAMWRLSIGR
jgi:hypothetical protein